VIPVLVLPIISRPDLGRRMLRSVGPVERLVIVDNTPDHDIDLGPALYIRPIIGLGYSGGVNAGISQTPDAAWWLICSNDLVFTPGDIDHITATIEAADGPTVVTGSTAGSRCLRWTYAAVNRATIERVGLVDEWSFWPIYFDDVDYERRCRLGGVDWIEYDGDIRHGVGGWEGSTTIKTDTRYSAANSRTFTENRDRYVAKWGGPPGGETFSTPWGLDVPLSYTVPDLDGRARRIW
jgi:hypothetical protein